MQKVETNPTVLTVNPQFRNFLPELNQNQKQELEKDIIVRGCLSPIIVQKDTNIILDGHNRYDICVRNNIKFETVSLDLSDEADIKIWMLKHQLNRRDLSLYEKIILALKMNDHFSKLAAEKRNSKLKNSTADNPNSDERENLQEMNTNKYLAKLCNVSHNTIAQVKRIEKKIGDNTRRELIEQKTSINKVYTDLLKDEENLLMKRMNKQKINLSKKSVKVRKPHKSRKDDDNTSQKKHRILHMSKYMTLITHNYYPDFYETIYNYFDKVSTIVFLKSESSDIAKNIELLNKKNYRYETCIPCFNENSPSEIYFLIIASNRYYRYDTLSQKLPPIVVVKNSNENISESIEEIISNTYKDDCIVMYRNPDKLECE
jgi:hypothetical protein